MTGPSWLAGTFAGVMVAVSIYCLARLVIAGVERRPTEHDVDVAHAVMGIAMAGMLADGLRLLPNSAWAVVFGAGVAWFAWPVGRGFLSRPGDSAVGTVISGTAVSGTGADGADAARGQAGSERTHHLPHLIMSGSMVYMLLAVPGQAAGAGGVSGMAMGGVAAGARFSVLALIMAAFFCGYAVWETDRLPRIPRVARAASSGRAANLADPSRASTAVPAALTGAARAVSPRLAACSQIAMAVTMGYMLVTML